MIARILQTISRSTFVRILLYLLVVAAIIFALYHVMSINNFFISSRKRRVKKGVSGGDADELLENIDRKLSEAIAANNYREAVRFMYLRTLKALSEKNIITLHSKSTNRDYIQQLNKHHGYAQFSRLTHIYEYVWYGEFDPTETQFRMISSDFNRFNP